MVILRSDEAATALDSLRESLQALRAKAQESLQTVSDRIAADGAADHEMRVRDRAGTCRPTRLRQV